MKTVLIVEDEKLIRQGIRVMIQRSGVPVEVIMECGNGEAALEVIRGQEIDVMFTDIRMPKMDGIELVKRMQDCRHVPLTVAVSGYDDFSYAVEMMRSGVREYILKPVEREKITEVLKKLNDEIERGREEKRENRRLDHQQIRYLMLQDQMPEEELQVLEARYESGEPGRETWEFYGRDYVACCRNVRESQEIREDNYIYLKDLEGSDVFIIGVESLELLLKNELYQSCTGISGPHRGLRELSGAYREALSMRKRAFCREMPQARFGETRERVPEELAREAAKLLTPGAGMQRVQLLGAGRSPGPQPEMSNVAGAVRSRGADGGSEMERVWNHLFREVRAGRISPEDYESCMLRFFEETERTYSTLFGERREELAAFRELWREDGLERYKEKFIPWLASLHEEILGRLDVSQNRRKLQQAVDYIHQNYARDLNMAVVSNHISMNYSLFSYSFKQFTGSNFVNYLKEIRMREAKRLLAQTQLRVNEISQAVGYDNEKHFMKLFKAACGVSPSEYRKNARLGGNASDTCV